MLEQEIKVNRPAEVALKKSGKAWLIISLIIIALLLAGAGVGYWQLTKSFNKQKSDLQKQIDDLNKKLSAAKAETEAATKATQTTTPTTTAFDYSGWNTYTNDKYNYQFKYPDSATIAEAQKADFSMSPEESAAGKTFDQLYAELTGKICLYVKNGGSSIYISAPNNADFSHVICGRTGVGTEAQLVPASETIVIDGKNYTANGDTDNLVVSLDDGTRIEYAGDLAGDSGTIIRHIVESYKAI